MLNLDIIFHSLYPTLILISVVPKFDLSHRIIHLPVIQAFYDYYLLQSIARDSFFYSILFFSIFFLTNILPYRHNDTLHPENLSFFILTFLYSHGK